MQLLIFNFLFLSILRCIVYLMIFWKITISCISSWVLWRKALTWWILSAAVQMHLTTSYSLSLWLLTGLELCFSCSLSLFPNKLRRLNCIWLRIWHLTIYSAVNSVRYTAFTQHLLVYNFVSTTGSNSLFYKKDLGVCLLYDMIFV